MVSIDIYINETTRHAHLILPPVAALERSHYDVVFHALAVRNTAKWGLPVIAPPPDRKTDWDILYELGMKLGGVRTGLPAVDRALKLAHRAGLAPTADQVVDILLRTGAYGDHFNPFSSGLSLRKLAAAPHGIDLGPLRPAAKEKVRTSDGKVELAPQVLLDDLPRVERWLEARREDAMVLIGRRHLRTNNSWMHNCRSLAKGPDRTALLLNPDDAARLGVCDGQSVRVTSRVGTVNATARLSDEVMPGVVSLPHGYGHAAAVETMRISGALAGPNINLLTDEAFLDPVSGTAALNGVPVTIQAVA